MTEPESPVAANLKRHRKKAGLTQEEVAQKVEVVVRTIAKWERNESQPSWLYLLRLAELYGTTVPDFYAQVKSTDRRAS